MTALPFHFYAPDEAAVASDLQQVAYIPADIPTKTALLEVIASAARLPWYFGGNWDALEECLADLDWSEPPRLVISHADLPLTHDTASCATYLSILQACVVLAQDSKGRGLSVEFPVSAQLMVEATLRVA
jgi:Barstar (barnase inhibitor)